MKREQALLHVIICKLGNDSYHILHIKLESLSFSFRSDMLAKVNAFFHDVLTAGGVCV